MEIVWSPDARINFEELVKFLERKWEKKVIEKLFFELNRNLNLIHKNPYLCPVISEKKKIRKCVIRKKNVIVL